MDIFYAHEPESDYPKAAARTAMQIHVSEPEGDILIFLTGEKEIREVCLQIVNGCERFEREFGPVSTAQVNSFNSAKYRHNSINKRNIGTPITSTNQISTRLLHQQTQNRDTNSTDRPNIDTPTPYTNSVDMPNISTPTPSTDQISAHQLH